MTTKEPTNIFEIITRTVHALAAACGFKNASEERQPAGLPPEGTETPQTNDACRPDGTFPAEQEPQPDRASAVTPPAIREEGAGSGEGEGR
jgi:hypothetical protein